MAVFPDGCGVTPQRPRLIAPRVSRLDTAASVARAQHIPAERSVSPAQAAASSAEAAAHPSDVAALPDERRNITRPKPAPSRPEARIPRGLKPGPLPSRSPHLPGLKPYPRRPPATMPPAEVRSMSFHWRPPDTPRAAVAQLAAAGPFGTIASVYNRWAFQIPRSTTSGGDSA
jgi:hypothetical protein